MASINTPKGSPSIDMTPMVDLAFLLVTFFMLAASFKSDEPITVNTPSSIGEKEIPEKTLIQVTVDKGGRLFFTCTGEEVRKNIYVSMCKKYNLPIVKSQLEAFIKTTSIGCSMAQLPQYLDMEGAQRTEFLSNPQVMGIPADSTNNQLKEWINFANKEMLVYGEKKYKEAVKNGGKTPPIADDFKPKFVLKVEGSAEYVRAKAAIEVFRDLNLNNLNFVTSQEAKPE